MSSGCLLFAGMFHMHSHMFKCPWHWNVKWTFMQTYSTAITMVCNSMQVRAKTCKTSSQKQVNYIKMLHCQHRTSRNETCIVQWCHAVSWYIGHSVWRVWQYSWTAPMSGIKFSPIDHLASWTNIYIYKPLVQYHGHSWDSMTNRWRYLSNTK